MGTNLFLHLELSDTPFSEKLANHFKRVNGKGKVSQSSMIVMQSGKQQPKGMFYRSRTAAEEQWQFWHSNFFPICWYWHNIWPKQIYSCWVFASPILMQITKQNSSRNLYHNAKISWCGNINTIMQIYFRESKSDPKNSMHFLLQEKPSPPLVTR